jgi:hypothetical protein
VILRQVLEARVLEAVRVVIGGGKIEDDHLECKGSWIDPGRAARLIAGAANAAGGQPIIWIVGLHEDQHRIVPLDDTDIADWWPAVASHFSETKPEVQVVNIPADGGQAVMALAFSTESAPYVVNVDRNGTVKREVPWREGTTLRSAYRRDLIRILVPRIPIPDIAVLRIDVSAQYISAKMIAGLPESDEYVNVTINGDLYFEAASPVSLPRHLARMSLRFNNKNLEPIQELIPFRGNVSDSNSGVHPRSVFARTDAVHVGGSGLTQIMGGFRRPSSERLYISTVAEIEIDFTFGVGLNGPSLRVPSRLKHIVGSEDNSSGMLGKWQIADDRFGDL